MRAARAYFGLQALAGAAWWVAVFAWPWVRQETLGSLDPVAVATLDIPLFVAGSAIAAFGVRWAIVLSTAWTTVVAVALAIFATLTGEAGWGVLLMAASAGASVLAACLLLFGRVPTGWMIVGPFAFRAAESVTATHRPHHVFATFRQIVVFWGLFLVVIPLVIAFLERRWMLALTFPLPVTLIGALLLVSASALGIWSAVVMSTLGDGTPLPSAMPNRLVIAGPYRFIRNPMAFAGIVQGAAVGLLLSSLLVVVYAIAGSLLWNYAIRPLEEADLEERFGPDFRRYTAEVRCWVPSIPKSLSA
ncbi:isoprenylcysteine carboxylmethyltransferase family protein [Subtercola sp. Z020]|uniref:isoprenylcysteine carboxylmethyltransferase family protein n=1 Tax=Subtercola sp. Z020 TaxID=2080582 RepID=UPI001E38AF3F|nr:methyltransferase [Subtercola sp. Z020]